MKKLIRFFELMYLSVFFSWKAPFWPWTFWSILSFFIAIFLVNYLKLDYKTILFLPVLITIISIPIINNYEKVKKKHDLWEIVIDELVWVFIAFWMILAFSQSLYFLILSLLLFRLFDIFKPWIIWKVDKNMKWWMWVMMDDIVAWIFAWISTIILYLVYSYFWVVIFYQVLICIFIVWFTIFITNFLVSNEKTKKIIIKNIFFHPNSISYYRIFLSVMWIILYIFSYETLWISIIALACITDYSDWVIARKCNLETQLWKSLDPLSDKINYFVPLFYFTIIWKISLILTIMFFIIDFLWQFSRIILKKLNKETKANYFWKLKTSVTFILMFYIMIFDKSNILEKPYLYYNIILSIVLFLAILSIVFKFYDYKNFIRILNKKFWR